MLKLYQPPKKSHKGQNGVLLIIGGSKKYHGALLYAGQMAAKIVDLIYIYTNKENQEVIKKLKPQFPGFIAIEKKELGRYIKKSDCLLIGPGLENKKITNQILKKYPEKKFILDAGAFAGLNKKLLNRNIVLTPHHGEYKKLFKDLSVRHAAKKYNCTILRKGSIDEICNWRKCCYNKGGNAGMTKGGTGDVLAGLVAGLACKNDLFTAASLASRLNKKAGERLFRKFKYYYNALDLYGEVYYLLRNI